ncbi:MAG TPA: response regulator [Spirochaetales bacterium]|nr:response regulator [Spirochaetales bacterium]
MLSDLQAIAVDDEEINVMLIESLAASINLKVKGFTDPLRALNYIKEQSVDLVFVDYKMPQMDGIELIRQTRAGNPDIPIVMITGVSGDDQLKIGAIEAGATEFLTKPINPSEFKARIRNLANLRIAQLLLRDRALLLEEEVKKATAGIIQQQHETLRVMGNAAEFKDTETAQHVMRVAGYSRLIATAIGDDKLNTELLYYAAPLHDIGKIGIPDSILLKPGKLTSEEFTVMKEHTTIGYKILDKASSPYLKMGATIAITHHEKYNGKGYPEGLRGADIPMTGRIVGIADVFDALTSVRPYKEAWPLQKAINLLVEEKGSQFDPQLVDLFTANIEEIKLIYNTHHDR